MYNLQRNRTCEIKIVSQGKVHIVVKTSVCSLNSVNLKKFTLKVDH